MAASVDPGKRRKWPGRIALACFAYVMFAMYRVFTGEVPQHSATAAPSQPSADTAHVAPVPLATPAAQQVATAPVTHDTVPAPVAPLKEVPAPKVKAITVYTTSTGDHYHRGSCSSLRKSKYATTLSEAKASGYEPCHRCDPPE